MGLDEREIIERDPGVAQSPAPRRGAALELQNVALRHRHEVLGVRDGAKADGAGHAHRGVDVGEDERGGAVGDERAIGALQRPGDEGILLALGAAEGEAEILAHLGVGVVDAVGVVLGGDLRQRVRLVAVTLEIGGGDLAEDAGEARRRVPVLGQV